MLACLGECLTQVIGQCLAEICCGVICGMLCDPKKNTVDGKNNADLPKKMEVRCQRRLLEVGESSDEDFSESEDDLIRTNPLHTEGVKMQQLR
ncbi:hypothetical protein EON64_03435 [archaeon]|nr:MAG: hypothetical protein EON64_03435 [archaeon]